MVRVFLILGIVFSIVLTVISYGKRIKRPDAVSMIVDSDSGNEIDDLFAITYALIEPRINLIGLTSAQWHHHPNAGDSSVYVSQKINADLLRLHDSEDIPHPRGANEPTGYWGDTKPIPSDAADFIQEAVYDLDYNEKVTVVTLGAPTNLATAIMLDTTIIPKIRWYAMGFRYDSKDKVWNKNEFNVRNDLDAMDYLLNRPELETHIMTATTSADYKFWKKNVFDRMEYQGDAWNYLVDRWKDCCPNDEGRIMWDVALLQAITSPDLVTEKEVSTPPENYQRKIFVYTWLNAEKMREEFFELVRKTMEDELLEQQQNEKRRNLPGS